MVALVAIAALMTSMPSLAHLRSAAVESRPALVESQSVREVAEAVVAAAREMVAGGGEQIVPHSALLLDLVALSEPAPRARPMLGLDDVHEAARSTIISERLLDLPPPVC